MRIFLDTEALLHWPSGIGVYVRNLLACLGRCGEDAPQVVTGYATARSGLRNQLHQRLREFGYEGGWHSWPLPGRVASWLGPLRGLACQPFLPPVDIVHGTSFLVPGYVPARKRLATIHDLGFVRHPERRFGGTGGDRMGAQVLAQIEQADRLFAISEFTKREICDLCGIAPERVSVTYMGTQWTDEELPDEPTVARALRKHGLERGKYFLTVGLVSPRKNFSALLDAFARFRQEQPDARLVLVGRDGWDVEPVLARLGDLAPYARRLDVSDAGELAALYLAARAFFLLSWYEGFGIPVLEAMQCGCPVCVSPAGAVAEVVGDAGLVIPPDDLPAAVDSMRRLWRDDALCAESRARGRQRSTLFTWMQTARQTLAGYQTALASEI